MESRVHSSLHQNCHHQLIYAKTNVKVFYPPPYEREVWHYQRANIDLIQLAIGQFSQEKSFRNLNINEMVFLLNKTIKNILSNYIPYETATSDDRDPPWSNNNIKQLIQEKNETYRRYISNDKNPRTFHKLKYLRNQRKNLVEYSQEKYYLLISKKKNQKSKINIKNIVKQQKNPCIPPLLQDSKYATVFKNKA